MARTVSQQVDLNPQNVLASVNNKVGKTNTSLKQKKPHGFITEQRPNLEQRIGRPNKGDRRFSNWMGRGFCVRAFVSIKGEQNRSVP